MVTLAFDANNSLQLTCQKITYSVGYCQARQKLPTILCRQVVREMIEQLRKMLGLEGHDAPRVYLLDGSSVELEHNRNIRNRFRHQLLTETEQEN